MPELRSKINLLPEDVRGRVVEFIDKKIDLAVKDILEDFGKEDDCEHAYVSIHCPINDPDEFIDEIKEISDGKLIGDGCVYEYYYDFIYDITHEIALKASYIMEDRLGFGMECIDFSLEKNINPCWYFLDTYNVYFELISPFENPDEVELLDEVGDWVVVSVDDDWYFEMQNKKDPNKRISMECFPWYSDKIGRNIFYACLDSWDMFRGA